jgi:hypothetical protein
MGGGHDDKLATWRRTRAMKVAWWPVVLVCMAGCGSGIGPHNPKVTQVPSVDPAPKTAPTMVYVTDFDLEFPQGQSQNPGLLRQGLLGQVRDGSRVAIRSRRRTPWWT